MWSRLIPGFACTVSDVPVAEGYGAGKAFAFVVCKVETLEEG